MNKGEIQDIEANIEILEKRDVWAKIHHLLFPYSIYELFKTRDLDGNINRHIRDLKILWAKEMKK